MALLVLCLLLATGCGGSAKLKASVKPRARAVPSTEAVTPPPSLLTTSTTSTTTTTTTTAASTTLPPETTSTTTTTMAAPPPVATVVSDPVRVRLPSIGVDAPIIDLGLNSDGTLAVPTDFGDVGWWRGGGHPGETEPAVLAGHVDSKTGPAVFYRLDDLRPGDPITVTGTDGSAVTFSVTHADKVPKDNFPTDAVYNGTDQPEIRLITCDGDFDRSTGHYVDNLVVYGRLA